jgi:hypothetical protein
MSKAQLLNDLQDEPMSAAAFFGHFHEEHEPDMRAWLGKLTAS